MPRQRSSACAVAGDLQAFQRFAHDSFVSRRAPWTSRVHVGHPRRPSPPIVWGEDCSACIRRCEPVHAYAHTHTHALTHTHSHTRTHTHTHTHALTHTHTHSRTAVPSVAPFALPSDSHPPRNLKAIRDCGRLRSADDWFRKGQVRMRAAPWPYPAAIPSPTGLIVAGQPHCRMRRTERNCCA